jgi:heme oxygenase
MTPSPILQQLRTETRAAHDALETQPFNQAIQAGTISTAATTHFLGRLYGFLLPYEAQLRQHHFSPAWEIERRQRAYLIEQDLGAAVADLPICGALPPLETEAQLLGALYVMEGSTLGGQVIARQLEKAGIPQQAYFRGNAEATGSLWKSFCQLLTDAATSDNAPEIVESARLTFQHLDAWLNQP